MVFRLDTALRRVLQRAIFGSFLALYSLLLAPFASAQQAPATQPQQQAVPPAAPQAQSPPDSAQPSSPQDQSTQVQIGSVLGNDNEKLVNRLGALLFNHDFLEMERVIEQSDSSASPARLNPEQTQLYKGLLANRENKPQESIQLLEPLLAKIKSTDHPPSEKELRKSLAEDYLRAGDYVRANQSFLELEYRFGGTMTADEKAEIELPLKLLPLAIANPKMTVEPGDAFSLPYDRNALGLTDVPVFVDAQSHDWMLDPTAPFNLICRSTAKEVGLKVSEASATVNSLTGRPMVVHMTVIPRFTLGTITFRNMTAFVFEDADYYFPRSAYQVRGVLGYPAVSALGSLTVSADAKIEVQPGEKGERLTTGARFFLDGDQIVAALGKPGEERMYAIDAGGQQTYLTSRYFAEHDGDFAGKKMQMLPVPSARTKPPAPGYIAERVTLTAGDIPMPLSYVEVFTDPLDSAALDDTYGVLGMEALEELRSYTFDYRTMRFAVRSE